jgi:hypothetical protein
VTSAQRARLVVALGVLNLVLATLAFAVGIGAPRPPLGGVAAAPTPAPPSLAAVSPSVEPVPTSAPAPTGPASSPTSAPPSVALPSVAPQPTEIPIGGVAVAERPPNNPPATSAPTSAPTTSPPRPTPTPASTPAPTTKPKPPPTPQPAAKPAHPPCPGTIDGPPGHNKGQPYDKPCGKGGNGGGGDNGHGKDSNGGKGGVILAFPVGLAAFVAGSRRRIARSLRTRPLAR